MLEKYKSMSFERTSKMKSNSESLFVKRKNKMNNKVYKDTETTSHMGFPVIYSRNHELDQDDLIRSKECNLTCNQREFLHNQLRPVIIVLRVLGTFPVKFGYKGKKQIN